MLIDTHAHLYWESFQKDFDQVIKRSLDAGVTTIINVGVDVELSKKATILESDKIKFYSTIGIHPHDSVNYSTDESIHKDIDKLEKIYQENISKCVAVGECGLDYLFTNIDRHVAKAPRDDNTIKSLQRQLFQAQIDLAKKLKLPLIVHCRDDRSKGSGSTGHSTLREEPSSSDSKSSPPPETLSPSAWDEVLQMIGNHPTILHCYSGLNKTTQKVIKMPNTLVSFAATITYPKNEYLREAAKILPLERIVLETDCPFLPPQSKRGQRNEPSAVLEIAQLVADLKGISLKEVAEQTTKNAREILRLRSG